MIIKLISISFYHFFYQLYDSLKFTFFFIWKYNCVLIKKNFIFYMHMHWMFHVWNV